MSQAQGLPSDPGIREAGRVPVRALHTTTGGPVTRTEPCWFPALSAADLQFFGPDRALKSAAAAEADRGT